MKKKLLCIMLAAVLLMMQPIAAKAVTIAELKQQLAETQSQLDAISGQASGIEGKKDAVEEEIEELDGNLIELMGSISLLEDAIEEKKAEIKVAQAELEAAVKKEQEQYEAMKKRIKFMYEKGDATYVQLLFESKSINDMMNKADYIERLYEYDRKMLTEYQKARQEVADLRDALEIEKADLEEQEHALQEEKAELEVLLNEKKAEAKNFEVQLAQVQQSAAAYKALIKKQTAQIKQLEAEEAARKAREEAAKNKNTTQSTSKSPGVASAQAVSLINSAKGSAKGKEIATYACRFVGNPYVAGGTSLTNGADCSGFTQAVYRDFGISIPRNSTAQRSYGKSVSYDEAEPGDIVCYAGHVGMYIGNGYIVHASTQKTGIKLSVATYRPILSIRRII